MNRFLIVFTKDDKEKLIKKGFEYVGSRGNSYIFKNNSNIHLESNIVTMPTNKVCL